MPVAGSSRAGDVSRQQHCAPDTSRRARGARAHTCRGAPPCPSPASARARARLPVMMGVSMTSAPGGIISRSDELVEISTQRLGGGAEGRGRFQTLRVLARPFWHACKAPSSAANGGEASKRRRPKSLPPLSAPVVGARGALHEAGRRVELAAHLLHHRERGLAHALHGHGAEPEGEHGAHEEASKHLGAVRVLRVLLCGLCACSEVEKGAPHNPLFRRAKQAPAHASPNTPWGPGWSC